MVPLGQLRYSFRRLYSTRVVKAGQNQKIRNRDGCISVHDYGEGNGAFIKK